MLRSLQTVNRNYRSKKSDFDNPKPETTRAFEVGLDATLFNNKLNLDVTIYQSTMENQFMRITTATGQTKPINSGKIRNRGIEFTTNYNVISTKDFRWSTGLNLSYNEYKNYGYIYCTGWNN